MVQIKAHPHSTTILGESGSPKRDVGPTLTERKEGREARQSSGRTLASDETLKAVGPFYLVSMPGEVKDPTQGVNV